MTGDWRDYRPAIWLAMLGVAIMLLVNPFYIGAFFLGGAIGAAIRITRRRRRPPPRKQRPRGRGR